MDMRRLMALVLGLLMLMTTVASADLATDTDIPEPASGGTQPVEGEEPAPEEEQPEEKSYLLSLVEEAEVRTWIEYYDGSEWWELFVGETLDLNDQTVEEVTAFAQFTTDHPIEDSDLADLKARFVQSSGT